MKESTPDKAEPKLEVESENSLDQARSQEDSTKVSVGGFGGGVDDNRMFDKVMKPCIQKLVASLLKVALH